MLGDRRIKSFNAYWVSVGWSKCRCDDMPYNGERNLIFGSLIARIFALCSVRHYPT